MNTSRKAAKALNEKLTGMLYAEDIGFRLVKDPGETGKSLTIKLDKKSPKDIVIDANGVKIFLDPESAATLKNCELDYREVPETGFLIKTCRSKSLSDN